MATTNRIIRFGLRNFKAFHYLEDIDIRPLTVLVGANSSGKSSLLQSLLLLKQTSLAARFRGALKFDGEWTKLGNFESVISDFDLAQLLEYRFQVDFQIDSGKSAIADILIRFTAQAETGEARLEEFTVATRVSRSIALGLFGHPWPDVATPMPGGIVPDQEISVTAREDGKTTGTNLLTGWMKGQQIVLRDVTIEKFWPNEFVIETHVASPSAANSVLSPPFASRTTLASTITEVSVPPQILRQILEDQVEHLGPVRADPRPFYPVEETPDIGSRGEETIPYLLHHQKDEVRYAPALTGELLDATLLEATNDWLQRMGVTTQLTIAPVESIAYVARVQSPSASDRLVNLSQVGFGVSQLLPVLITGLKRPDNGFLLFEQPESQLHPRLQSALAEFLLCVARAGKTVMVETHSDHLLHRLRRCIAEDETGTLADMVSILFVHPGTPDNPGSYVEPLQIDENGNIVNWPPDFLGETANESLAILRAAQRKAHAHRK